MAILTPLTTFWRHEYCTTSLEEETPEVTRLETPIMCISYVSWILITITHLKTCVVLAQLYLL